MNTWPNTAFMRKETFQSHKRELRLRLGGWGARQLTQLENFSTKIRESFSNWKIGIHGLYPAANFSLFYPHTTWKQLFFPNTHHNSCSSAHTHTQTHLHPLILLPVTICTLNSHTLFTHQPQSTFPTIHWFFTALLQFILLFYCRPPFSNLQHWGTHGDYHRFHWLDEIVIPSLFKHPYKRIWRSRGKWTGMLWLWV